MSPILKCMAMLLLAAASSAYGTPGGLVYSHPSSSYYHTPASGGYATYHGHGYHALAAHPPVLTVLAEHPLAADPVTTSVPLVAMPQDQIHVVHGNIAGVSRVKPYVQVKVQDHMEEAMPAVKVQLRRPIVVSSLHSSIAFPQRFTVLHNGYSSPLSVGAVIAPLPVGTHLTPSHPATVNYVYAIPSAPFHYPAYYNHPVYSYPVAKPVVATVAKPVVPTTSPALAAEKPHPSPTPVPAVETPVKPQDPQVSNRPEAPIVTVLDFPTNVASPPALFYQPPATGLGNREPPQAVAPAGIVQSTQPQPNLSFFINSKESPYLQILRDEAQRNRNKIAQDDPQVVFVN